MSLGARIKFIREKQGLTQMQLAEKIGSVQKNISAYEKDVTNPTAPVLKRIAEALQTDANYLLDTPSKGRAEHPLMPMLRDIENMGIKERTALLTMIQTFLNTYKKSKNK